MKLAAYLATEKVTATALAEQIGEGVWQVSKWAHGTRIPSLEQAARIREATKGKVTFDDFLSAPDIDL